MDFNCIVDKDFSGVISIMQRDKIIYEKAYGYADMPNKIHNTVDTKFETASAGKVFVATSILKLIEQNLLKFDSCIGDILRFNLKQIDPKITIKQLLNHTSGIPDYFDESIMDDYEELWISVPNYRIRQSSDLIPLFIDKPMMYPKGEKFQYNNSGFVVLGLIIEEITKLPFDEYIKKIVFEPCGMSSTGYYELDRLPAKCANSYIYDDVRKEYRTNIFSIDAKGTGAGGAFTTAPDVKIFWDNLLSYKLINEELLNLMLSPQVSEKCYGYGGWLLQGEIPSFMGGDPGANFMTSYDLETKVCITLLSNIDVDICEFIVYCIHRDYFNNLEI